MTIYWQYYPKRSIALSCYYAIVCIIESYESRTVTFQKNLCYLLDWKPFKNDKRWSLFHRKSSFHSQSIWVFVTIFSSTRKNRLIRKIRLTSKFMTSLADLHTIAIHILPNMSRSKGNQKMKFGQLIKYNKKKIFLQNVCGKWGREASSRPLFIFWKSLIWGESKRSLA